MRWPGRWRECRNTRASTRKSDFHSGASAIGSAFSGSIRTGSGSSARCALRSKLQTVKGGGHAVSGMPIRQWPAQERPREKLLRQGAHAMTDAELVAILLRGGTARRSALDVARSLLIEAKTLRGLCGKTS